MTAKLTASLAYKRAGRALQTAPSYSKISSLQSDLYFKNNLYFSGWLYPIAQQEYIS
jgi:hypothetical protein